MSSDVELDCKESEADTRERWRLQRKWWKRLAAHPDATLHRHISPGKLLMFGIGGDGQQCLLAPGLSLNYVVWQDQCEVSLCLDDESDPHPEYPLKPRPTNDWERIAYSELLNEKEGIEASFGEALYWSEGGLITYYMDGGYGILEEKWDEIIFRQVNAMNRLHAALLPYVGGIPNKNN